MGKQVALVVAKRKLDSKVWPKESVFGLVKLNFVDDCFLAGDLYVLFLKRKFPSVLYVLALMSRSY